jgi:mannose-6-phosphate isomerase-like protein (cupin superfamily)
VNLNDLKKLHAAVESLLRQESFSKAVECLRLELSGSAEPFVWSTVDLGTLGVALPASIKSGWIFLLRSDAPSGCHYHPNSVQHMVALNGQGRSKVGSLERPMIPFGSDRHSIEEKWYVIGEGVPHEFFPEGEDMTVVSFHTCEPSELEEIAWGSGTSRKYESSDILTAQLEP